jgi:hypothetical protein
MIKKLDISISLGTAKAIGTFVRDVISSFPGFQEHKDISTGELIVDDSRKAYIGKIEGNICAWYPIWDELNTVKDLPQILGTKDSLHLCIPVERKQHETNPPASKPSRRSRVESISDTQGSTSKRPQSGTRTSKKEVDTKVKIKAKKEVKQEVKVEYDSEIDVDSEVDSKNNWEAKQEDILGSVDANNGLLDEDIVSDNDDLKKKLKE